MGHVRLTFLARYDALPERLFDVLADVNGMSRWTPFAIKLLSGDGGTGSVRRLSRFGMSFDEELIEVTRPSRIVYRVTRGLPLDYHRGEVRVEPWGLAESSLHWDVTLYSKIPGVAESIGKALERGFNKSLEDLRRLV